MTRNRPGQKLRALLQEIADLDAECRSEASQLPDHLARIVESSIEETRIGGSRLRQLSGMDPVCPAAKTLHSLKELEDRQVDPAVVRELVRLLVGKVERLGQVRRDARYQALLQLWLLVHVPLSIAAIVAVAAHVLAVFYLR